MRRKVGTPSPQSTVPALLAEKIVESLSYSHFELLAAIDDPLKRAFYEIECVRGAWAVRELKRQIASLYYERSSSIKLPPLPPLALADARTL